MRSMRSGLTRPAGLPLYSAQAAIATVERAMELVGGASFYRDLGLERAFRDVQGARFHPLQEVPQLELTGRMALGMGIDG